MKPEKRLLQRTICRLATQALQAILEDLGQNSNAVIHPLLAAAASALALISFEASAFRLTPPVLPLIVRNPYLRLWLNHARKKPWKRWPMFLGWPGGMPSVEDVLFVCTAVNV